LDEFIKYRDGNISSVTVVTPKAGSKFHYANQENGSGHDGLHISFPDKCIINDADDDQEFNDASYILTYWSQGGRIVFPGDAQEESWELAAEKYPSKVEDCSFLLASSSRQKVWKLLISKSC
jgi:hypothetical protein